MTHVLRDIPAADAWGLLSRHWGVLKHRPQFIAIALYCGTPESTRFATDAVAQFGAADLSFLDIESTFAFMDSSRAHKLNATHLANLEPYIQNISNFSMSSMVHFCRVYGHWDWALRVLQPECRRRANKTPVAAGGGPTYIDRLLRNSFPTDADLLEDLDRIDKYEDEYNVQVHLHLWIEAFTARMDHPNRIVSVLELWLKQSSSVKRLNIAGIILKRCGERENLSLLKSTRADQEINILVDDIRYAVMRQSLE